MQGRVIKIHSDFYYVQNDEHKLIECKIREILKKQKIEITVGDFVEFENEFIVNRLKRKNTLLRPKVSNIDLALVVVSFKQPDLDFIQLNRYLIYLKYHKIDSAICINKEDLENNLKEKSSEIEDIYSKLGYKLFFISAKNNIGIDKVKKYIKNKTIVLCGQSGVGKSTLLNAIIPDFNARTSDVSSKTQKGRHTTRHCELIEYSDFAVMDTPGFSCLKFDFLLPEELFNLFDDLKIYSDCKYSNCNHDTKERGICSVVDNLDKIETTRYKSYLEFLKESTAYRDKISKNSIKIEKNFKNSGNKTLAKISKKKRDVSRNVIKQSLRET